GDRISDSEYHGKNSGAKSVMNPLPIFLCWILSALPVLALSFFSFDTAFAAETPQDWREPYDLIMKWVNFLILLFIFIKYARVPLKNFLNDQKADLEQEIQRLENEKIEFLEKQKNAVKLLDESAAALNLKKERLLKEGEREKARLVDEARLQSQMMLESAKQKAEYQLSQAKAIFRSRLIDSAIALAMERLPDQITGEDQQKFIGQFTGD
ncbi:MAG: ATP synthase F0 subunit B, partial [Thermodesulfobacteriota bacterium]